MLRFESKCVSTPILIDVQKHRTAASRGFDVKLPRVLTILLREFKVAVVATGI
jgi:hypothetical protein